VTEHMPGSVGTAIAKSQLSQVPGITPSARILVQCDFDGTVTVEDASFIMLDAFAGGKWREINAEYEAGRITVGRFNSEAFSLVKATRQSLLKSIEGKVHIRPGFEDFAAYCRGNGLRLVIVSNGLDFYIDEILKSIGLPDLEFHGSRTEFEDLSVSVTYVGPDGTELDDSFKEAYVKRFHDEGYRVVYVGNGSSDFRPARESDYVFATGTLLKACRKASLGCSAFDDFRDVVRELDATLRPT
jgi:2-hydroxy-3-keto-5-methylthiopentenyl-1-phosphate phosphatase